MSGPNANYNDGGRSSERKTADRKTAKKLKKRKPKRKEQSFCQRLVESLDAYPIVQQRSLKKRRRPLAILELPTEVRQQILYATIPDDELINTDLDRSAASLKRVCRVFKEEIVWVVEQWRRRAEALRAVHRGTFDAFIQDLLSSNHITLGKPAPISLPAGGQQRSRQEQAGAQSEGQFSAMDKWRERRMADVRKEECARRRGDWSAFGGMRKKAALKKKEQKFGRLSFLSRDEEADRRDIKIGTIIGETGTFVTLPLSNKNLMKQKRSIAGQRMRRKQRQKAKALRVVADSIDTGLKSPEDILSKEKLEAREPRKNGRAMLGHTIKKMERESVENNPAAAAKWDNREQLRRAYGGLSVVQAKKRSFRARE